MSVAPLASYISALALLVTPQLFAQSHGTFTAQVSIVNLVANPKNFEGKYIQISGVAYFDSKSAINAICLSRDDKRAANGTNCIFLYFGPSIKDMDRLNDKYVFAQGVFRGYDHGHLGSFAGSLDKVDRVEAIRWLIK
jgi:hypothetical protein